MNQPVCREGAFADFNHDQVAGTLAMLRYYRRVARDLPEGAMAPRFGRENRGLLMGREEAANRLQGLILVAILKKAGSVPPLNHRGRDCRKWDSMEQVRMARDCRAVRDRVNRRVRVYQFETKEVRRRFGHLLSRYDED
jgi:hypothetical protein